MRVGRPRHEKTPNSRRGPFRVLPSALLQLCRPMSDFAAANASRKEAGSE